MKQSLRTSFDIYWNKMINNDISMRCKEGGNKLRTYRKFKTCIKYEKYLNIRNVEIRKNITRLRISAHKLRIETERFNNKLQYIPPEMRTCLNCNRKETEDEFHVIIACPKYSSIRDDLFQKCKILNKYFNEYGDKEKFIWIMSNERYR